MEQEKAVSRLRKKIAEQEAALPALEEGYLDFSEAQSRRIRKTLVHLAHAYYLLTMLDGEQDADNKIQRYLSAATQLLRQAVEGGQITARGKESVLKEQVGMRTIDLHSRTWNLALYYYEKGCRTLCQMIISLMDERLQREGVPSVLYPNGKGDALSLTAELRGLREEWMVYLRWLTVFDFCVEKLGQFLKLPEYGALVKEHERLAMNGLADKVRKAFLLVGGGEEDTAFLRAGIAQTELQRIYEEVTVPKGEAVWLLDLPVLVSRMDAEVMAQGGLRF